MEFGTVVRRRRMVRAFQNRPVEAEKLARLLEYAQRAPSAGHLEPQEFILVQDATRKRQLAEAALGQEFIVQAPVVIVVCADARRTTWRYGQRGWERYCITDGAFASLLILLTAVDEGLGACFVGAFRDAEVARVLGLPPQVRPIGIIPIGYPGEGPVRVGRRPLAERVHLEGWGNPLPPAPSLHQALTAWLGTSSSTVHPTF
ncbi:MAG: nitroreductase family protein [Dehalococcoidia bacterium]|nr:nitroreductase family protein [Dehalococcoidia bacterium]MDW8119877.1 nitroreductase family protein [Chloroflexota bacterium]